MIMEMRSIHLLEPVKIDGVSYRAGTAIMPTTAAEACIANGWGLRRSPDDNDRTLSYRFIDTFRFIESPRDQEFSPCKKS